MTRAGNSRMTSNIEIYNLGDYVKEMWVKGYSLTEIQRMIQTERGITVGRMSISRYLAKHSHDNIKPNKIYTHKDELKEKVVDNSVMLLSNIDSFYTLMRGVIHDCKLPPVEKGEELRLLEIQYKQMRENILDSKVQIMQLFQAISTYDVNFKNVLIEISKGLCLDCRKHIVDEIKEYEKSLK